MLKDMDGRVPFMQQAAFSREQQQDFLGLLTRLGPGSRQLDTSASTLLKKRSSGVPFIVVCRVIIATFAGTQQCSEPKPLQPQKQYNSIVDQRLLCVSQKAVPKQLKQD